MNFSPRLWIIILVFLSPAVSIAQCTLDNNPSCSAAVNLGDLSGDTGTPMVTRTGAGEAFFTVRLKEEATTTRNLSAAFALQVPPDMDYDLIVRCASCASSVQKASNGTVGVREEIRVVRTDTFTDNSTVLVIEVRFRSGKSCALWTLTVSGNSGSGTSPLSCG